MGETAGRRWLPMPEHVELAPGVLPAGFVAAGVACGLKPSGNPDLGLLVSRAPETVSAVRLTRSGMPAAPVRLTRERTTAGGVRAVVVNSGNANAATGNRGFEDAARMQGAAAMACRVPESACAVGSTGVIGVPLDTTLVVKGIARARGELDEYGAGDFSAAIQTTDRWEKVVEADVTLPSGTVRLCAQAKGAGMMQPNFATMLCFVETDAQLDAAGADALLGAAVARSFDRISVDGQLSTNDMVLLLASGASGVAAAAGTPDGDALQAALDWTLRTLALSIVADGEGARRVGRVRVGAPDAATAETGARAIANSPLVKTALHGGDPNWGRIVQALGGALLDTSLAPDVWIEGVQVCRKGAAAAHDTAALAQAVAGEEVDYRVDLGGGQAAAEAELFFSDLSYGYVELNAEYTT